MSASDETQPPQCPKCNAPVLDWRPYGRCAACQEPFSAAFDAEMELARSRRSVAPTSGAASTAREQTGRATFQYKVAPFMGRLKSGFMSVENASTVSAQLEVLIKEHARQGWEYVGMEKVDIEVQPGCLGQLLGQRVTYITFDQVVFRAPA